MAETDSYLHEQVAITQKLLSSLIAKPRITAQLLIKPPVKFIRDIFIEVSAATGCGQGLYTAAEVEGMSKSRENKFTFLTILLHFVAKVVNDPSLLSVVRITKVAAGLEPEKTNLLLQKLHEAATSESCRSRWQSSIDIARAGARQMLAIQSGQELIEDPEEGRFYSSPTPSHTTAYTAKNVEDVVTMDVQPLPGVQEDWAKLLYAEGFGGVEDGSLTRLARQVACLHCSVRQLVQVAVDDGHLLNMPEADFAQVIMRNVWPQSVTDPRLGATTDRSVRSEPEAEVSPDTPLDHQDSPPSRNVTKLPPVIKSSSPLQFGASSPSRLSPPKLDSNSFKRTSLPKDFKQLSTDSASSRDAVMLSKRDYLRSSMRQNMNRSPGKRNSDHGLYGDTSKRLPNGYGGSSSSKSAAKYRSDPSWGRTSSPVAIDMSSALASHELVRLTQTKAGPELIDEVEKALKDGVFDLCVPVDISACALPIHYAAACVKSPGLVKVMIEAKADVRVTFQGKEIWHGLHPGMTLLEFAAAQRKVHAAKGHGFERWEAIEEIVKAEIDRIRGWQLGRRNTRTFTTSKARLAELEATVPATHSDSSDSDGDLTFDRQLRSKITDNKDEVMRSLYTSKAGFMCEHYECHPSEVFEMNEKVGEGTFGSVWRSVNKTTGNERAIKQLPKMLLEDLSLWQEIAIMRQLDHPHIMKLFSTFEDHHNVFIVSELCSGGQLFDAIIESGAISERNAAAIMKQILQAVTYLHKHFICHRDLKPENFMIAAKCNIDDVHLKLIDFGTAKRFDLGEMTTKVCTVHYVAPDLLKNGMVAYSEKCDVWSCGVVLYVMLSGSPPFSGDTDMDVLKKVKKGKFAFKPKELWDYISQDACSLISKMLTVKATDRISADEACQDYWVEKLAPNSTGVNLANPRILGKMRNFSCYNKLKKVALQVIAQQLSDESIQTLQKQFIALDTDCVGALTVYQMEEALQQFECDEDMKLDLIYMMHEMAADTGEINYTQFIAANIERTDYLKDEACKAAFALCDVDGDGEITLHDLQLLFATQAIQDHQTGYDSSDAEFGKSAFDLLGVEQAEIERIMRESDTDGDGKISFDEFKVMMASKVLVSHTANSEAEVADQGTAAGLSSRRRISVMGGAPPPPGIAKKPKAPLAALDEGDLAEEARREAAKPKVAATIKKSATQVLQSKANGQEEKSKEAAQVVEQSTKRKSMDKRCSVQSVQSEAPKKMVKSATVIFGTKTQPGIGKISSGTDCLLQDNDYESTSTKAGIHIEAVAGPNPLWEVLSAQSISTEKLRDLLRVDARYVNHMLDQNEGVPSPLFFGVEVRMPELVQLFIEFRGDVRQKNEGAAWRSIRHGQTPLEANECQLVQYVGTASYDRCEAIRSLLKAEEDRNRRWRSGRRASEAASRFFNAGLPPTEGGAGEHFLSVPEVENEDEQGIRQDVARAAETELSKRTLYGAEGAGVCQHITGDPREVFKVCEQVGEGTFGVVSRMLDLATGLERAIKTVSKDLLEESDLWQEIELMRDFDHPYVARLYGTYEDSANLYMIMEHCSGGELFEAVENAGSLPETTAATIFQQMLIGVSYIHSKQVCHRDLKPENFLLSRPGPVERALVKLIDFGTARHFSSENPMTTKICTIHYVAPEILVRGAASYTEKCDIWSLGVCLFLMVCGSPPFYGDTDTVTLKQVRKGKFKFEPEDFWATMEEDIRLLISSLLQMSPQDRLSAKEALSHSWFAKKARRTSTSVRLAEVIPRLLRFRKSLWFKQKSVQLVANHLSENDVNDIRPLWFQFDINNNGKISHDELAQVIPVDGLSDELLHQRAELLEEMQADGKKGEIGYTAFLAAMLDADRLTRLVTCRSAFKEFDLDNDGFIRMTELSLIWQCDQLKTDTSDALGALAWRSTGPGKEACALVLETYDLDGDQALSLDEFIAMMKEEGPC